MNSDLPGDQNIRDRIRQLESDIFDLECYINDIWEFLPVSIFSLNPQGVIIDVNRSAEELFGYSRDEIVGKHLDAIFPGQIDEGILRTILSLKPVKNQELNLKDRSGKNLLVNINTFPRVYEPEKVIGYFMAIFDITELKEAEKLLTESEEKYRMTIDMMPEAIHVVDRDLNIVFFNEACKRWNRELNLKTDVLGLNIFEVFPFLSERVRQEYQWVIENGKLLVTEETTRVGEKDYVTETSKIPIFEGGRVSRVITVIRNITDKARHKSELEQSYRQLKKMMDGIVVALASAVEKRDPYTAGHQHRVTNLACAIAQEIGLMADQIEEIRVASILHDIGKIYVPSEILSKPTFLTEAEYSIVKTHPEIGYEILKNIEFPWPVAEIVLQHHERLNGSGYPKGLTSDLIIFESKILMVADVVEAMATHRPYRPARGIDVALDEIIKNSGILYDERVVEICLRLFKSKGFKFD
ncbi:MAG: HD domain-containing phosphohydrolase [candidate division WOR-3 bacterium]